MDTAAGRPRRGEATRARLLDAARVAFHGVGWNRARVEDVCRQAGVGHGTFYAYYGNKTAILEALVRQHAAALYELVEAPWTSFAAGPRLAAPPGGTPEEERAQLRSDVHRVIDGFVTLTEADRDIREIWLAAAPSEPVLAGLVGEVRGQFVARIRASLAAALAAGRARPELDVDVAARALAAMVEQTAALAAAASAHEQPGCAGQAPDRERLVTGLADLWVHAVYRL